MDSPDDDDFGKWNSWWRSWWHHLSELRNLPKDVKQYFRKLIFGFIVLVVAGGLMFLVSLYLSEFELFKDWIFVLSSVFLGMGALVLLCYAWPVLWAGKKFADQFPGANFAWLIKLFAAVVFWVLMLSIYFALVPMGQNHKAAVLFALLTGAIALGSYCGWIALSQSAMRFLLTLELIVIFLLVTFAAFFPKTARQSLESLAHIDARWASDQIPEPIAIPSVGQIELVDKATGEPLVWYYRSTDGDYELFNRRGFHSSGVPLKAVKTDADRQEIWDWIKQRQQDLADAAKKKADADAAEKAKAEAEANAKATARAKADSDARAMAEVKARAEAMAVEKAKRDFYDQRALLIANGSVPNLNILVNFSQDFSSCQLIVENRSEATIRTSEIRLDSLNGGITLFPLKLELPPKQKTWYRYERDLRGFRKLDFVCEGYREPFQVLLE